LTHRSTDTRPSSAEKFKRRLAPRLHASKLTDEQAAKLAAKVGCQTRSIRKRLSTLAGRRPEAVVRYLSEGGAA
jgi:hypothetical protein